MSDLIKIPAGPRFGLKATIRPAFYNTGIAGYFMIAAEIPQQFMDQPVPPEDYMLTFYREVPVRREWNQPCRLPTISEALWAVGFMNVELAGKICEAPMRFLHRPFPLHSGPGQRREIWRQIVVRRSGAGYSVETVRASAPISGMQLAYIFDPNYDHRGLSD